jgi:hypothetical protein
MLKGTLQVQLDELPNAFRFLIKHCIIRTEEVCPVVPCTQASA